MNGGFLFVIVILFAFMYLLLIRPQRQQQRRHTEMISSLKVGDEVITAGGIYGDVSEVQPDRVTVEVAEDVHIEVAKRAIASVVPPEEESGRDEPGELLAADAEAEPELSTSQEDVARR
jgi:preprotein translocase subunit YajC